MSISFCRVTVWTTVSCLGLIVSLVSAGQCLVDGDIKCCLIIVNNPPLLTRTCSNGASCGDVLKTHTLVPNPIHASSGYKDITFQPPVTCIYNRFMCNSITGECQPNGQIQEDCQPSKVTGQTCPQ